MSTQPESFGALEELLAYTTNTRVYLWRNRRAPKFLDLVGGRRSLITHHWVGKVEPPPGTGPVLESRSARSHGAISPEIGSRYEYSTRLSAGPVSSGAWVEEDRLIRQKLGIDGGYPRAQVHLASRSKCKPIITIRHTTRRTGQM